MTALRTFPKRYPAEKLSMRGMIAVEDVIASLPQERREAIEARGNELLAKVERRMSLVDLRKNRKINQAKIAEALGVGQMQISRLEMRKDPRLSTMQRTVAAMGGNLTMVVTFPDQDPVVLLPPQPTCERKSKQTAMTNAGTGSRDASRTKLKAAAQG
jgi:transcriptional regulator with XRE-family HTH domain